MLVAPLDGVDVVDAARRSTKRGHDQRVALERLVARTRQALRVGDLPGHVHEPGKQEIPGEHRVVVRRLRQLVDVVAQVSQCAHGRLDGRERFGVRRWVDRRWHPHPDPQHPVPPRRA
jgi:hypothetical protein